MAKKDFTTPLTLNGDYPNLDDRYTNNGDPYTSVSAAQTALASKLNAYHIGLTVLVKESGWTEAKEYWVQPKGTTPETYGLVVKGAGVTDYAALDNKPTINNVPLSGNKTASDLHLATAEQGGKADTAIQGVSVNGTEVTPDPTTKKVALTIENGKSAYQVWLDDGNTGTEADFFNSLKAHVSRFIPIATESGATSLEVGDTYAFSDVPSPTDGAMLLMPNGDTTTPKTLIFSVTSNGDTPETFTYTYVGELSISTEGFLSSDKIVQNLTAGGADKVPSAAAVKTLAENFKDTCMKRVASYIDLELDANPLQGRLRGSNGDYAYHKTQTVGGLADSKFKTGKIDIREYRGKKVVIRGGNKDTRIIITSANLDRTEGASITFATGWSGYVTVYAHRTRELSIPNDAYNLAYYAKAVSSDAPSTSYDCSPTFIKIKSEDTIGENIPQTLEVKFGDVSVIETMLNVTIVEDKSINGEDGSIDDSTSLMYGEVSCEGYNRIKFLGVCCKSATNVGYAFYNSNDVCIKSSNYDVDTTLSEIIAKEYIVDIPDDAVTFRATRNYVNQLDAYIKGITGLTLKDVVTEYVKQMLPHTDKLVEVEFRKGFESNGYLVTSSGNWSENPATNKCILIPVAEGTVVRLVKGQYGLRYAFLSVVNKVIGQQPTYIGSNGVISISTTNAIVEVPVPAGAKRLYVQTGDNAPAYIGVYLPEDAVEHFRSRINPSELLSQMPLSIPSVQKGELQEEVPDTLQVQNALKKALQLKNIKWTPKHNVPSKKEGTPGGGIVALRERSSIPYSSNNNDLKLVGIQVSLHTFMTAVNNPYSLIYTEKCAAADSKSAWGKTYDNNNAWAYYGTVCCGLTSSVYGNGMKIHNGVMGIMYRDFGEYKQLFPKGSVDFNVLRVGDLGNRGDQNVHSWMVYSIERDADGVVEYVSIIGSSSDTVTENGDGGIKIERYTKSVFENFVKSGARSLVGTAFGAYTMYRYKDAYKNTDYVPSPYVQLDGETAQIVEYNNEICTFAGDKASFAKGELVVLNYNLDDNHPATSIKVYKDDTLIETYTTTEANASYSDYANMSDEGYNDIDQTNHVLVLGTELLPGKYKACINDSENYTYWEVLDTDVQIIKNLNGYIIKFKEIPTTVYISSFTENRALKTYCCEVPTDKEQEMKQMTIYPYAEYLLNMYGYEYEPKIRVAVKGDYGIATGNVITLENL